MRDCYDSLLSAAAAAANSAYGITNVIHLHSNFNTYFLFLKRDLSVVCFITTSERLLYLHSVTESRNEIPGFTSQKKSPYSAHQTDHHFAHFLFQNFQNP